MKKFSEMTAKRRQVIEHLVATYPEIETEADGSIGTVTFKQIRDIWVNGKATENAAGEKLGYPLWLTVESEFRTDTRGLYAIPLDDGTAVPAKATKSTVAKVPKEPKVKTKKVEKLTAPKLSAIIDNSEKVDYTDAEFEAELKAAGIEF